MQRLHHFPWRWLVAFLMTILPLASLSHAQVEVRTFPETGHTVRGAFRFFWETNGGLPIFGYPITEEYSALGTGQLIQYFERARFELIRQNGDYTVALGMLGVEFSNNLAFPKSPPIQDTATRRYISQTQHIIQYGFKEVWETRGVERIFGWPISDEIDEILEDGNWHIVQYFERTRFEYWPTLPPGQRVIISDLGRKLAPSTAPAPQPAPQPGQGTPQASTPSARPTVSSPPTPCPTATVWPTSTPWSTLVPTSPPSSNCCKYCGPDSKPCGNSCISLNKTCHQPSGCACN